jgi:hypothetical protein
MGWKADVREKAKAAGYNHIKWYDGKAFADNGKGTPGTWYYKEGKVEEQPEGIARYADYRPGGVSLAAEKKAAEAKTQAGTTVTSGKTVTPGIIDGTLSMRVNGILPSKGSVWYIDPEDTTLTIKTVSELQGLGGKATGAIVLGTDKVALNTVAYGTYSDLTSESATTVLSVSDFPSLTGDGMVLKYQVIPATSRAAAFAAYKPDKALKYGTVHVATAGKKVSETPSDKEETPKVVTAGASKLGAIAEAALGVVKDHPRESFAAAIVASIIAFAGTRRHTRTRL